jgi:hypothetical protein
VRNALSLLPLLQIQIWQIMHSVKQIQQIYGVYLKLKIIVVFVAPHALEHMELTVYSKQPIHSVI